MSASRSRRTAAALLAATALAGIGAANVHAAGPLRDARVLAHLDLASGQLPENIVAAPDGAVDVTFAAARQVARIRRDGSVRVLATLPAPPASAKTPVLGFPLTTGLQRTADGTLYTLYATGDAATTGLWRIHPGGRPERIAALPADGLPNGLELDRSTRQLYIADSVKGTISRVSTGGGAVSTFSSDPALRTTGFLGVNGVRIQGGSLYASNLDLGTVVRLPLRGERNVGATTVARGLKGIDDFAFIGSSRRILAALDPGNQVVQIDPDGRHRAVLRRKDGLSNPTAVLVRGRTVYVPSAAYTTQRDPNLLTARLAG